MIGAPMSTVISASRTPALRSSVDGDRRSARAPGDGRRSPTCVVYTTDKDLGQARLEQIYHPAITAARRALVAAGGDLAILDLVAGGEPDLDELRAIGAEFAGLVIVYEITRAPLKIIQAFADAETVGFDALDPQWRRKLTSLVAQAVEDLVERRARRERTQPASLPNQTADGRSVDMFLDNAPVAASIGAFLGCLTTLDLTALGFFPCISSAAAAALLCGHLFVTRTKNVFAAAFFPALYGGTFAGMTPVLWLRAGASGHSAVLTGAMFVSLSILCGLAFFVVAGIDTRRTAPIGGGFGGRSGAIATVASFLFVQAAGLLGADASRFHGLGSDAFAVEPWALALGFAACLAGNVGTLLALRQARVASGGIADRIFVASVVALIGLTILQLWHPRDMRTLDAFYAGCFLGMSTPERMRGWFQPLLGAVVLSAVLVPVHAVLPGVGGGLGLAAFATVTVLVASSRVVIAGRALVTGRRPGPRPAARAAVQDADQYFVTTGA